MLRKGMLINDKDNVAVLLENAKKGDELCIAGKTIVLTEDIEFAHKAAIRDLEKEEDVIKYGHVIGFVTKKVDAGSWIHTHNMDCRRGHVRREG